MYVFIKYAHLQITETALRHENKCMHVAQVQMPPSLALRLHVDYGKQEDFRLRDRGQGATVRIVLSSVHAICSLVTRPRGNEAMPSVHQ